MTIIYLRGRKAKGRKLKALINNLLASGQSVRLEYL